MSSSFLCCCCPASVSSKFVNEPTQKTPLLSSDRKPGAGETVINQPAQVPVTDNGYYHGSSNDERRQAKKGPGKPRKISIGFTNVKAVDKRLQDHKKLYNEYHQKYEDLQGHVDDLCNAFGDENTEKTLEATFRLLRQKTRDCESLTVSRKPQHGYTRIEFEPREVPNDVLIQLNKFNSANKLIKELSEKGPKLIDSVQMVLKDETDLRRDVLAASMGTEGPECMQMCIGGVSELRKVPGFAEEILRRSKKIQKKGQKSVLLLTQDEESFGGSDVIAKIHTSGTSSSSEEKEQHGKNLLVDIGNESEPKTKIQTLLVDPSNEQKTNEVREEVPAETQAPAKTPQPPTETLQPPAETPQPPTIAQQQLAEIQQPPAETPQPPTETAQPPTETQLAEIQQAPAETQQPPAETPEPLVETLQQSMETQPPTETLRPPAETEPQQAETKPLTESVQPEAETQPPVETQQPPVETQTSDETKPHEDTDEMKQKTADDGENGEPVKTDQETAQDESPKETPQ